MLASSLPKRRILHALFVLLLNSDFMTINFLLVNGTACQYDELGLAEYEAMEAFVRYRY